jgi:RNA 2',3'-cyclic 3'-phosphodiesterase
MAEGTEKLRLFVAIHVPDVIKSELRRMQQALRTASGDSVRWSPPEQLHLTLLFLGYVDSSELPKLEEAFANLGQQSAPLRLSVQGLGCFPNERRPRVIWAGLAGDVEPLKVFQGKVQAALASWCQKEETRAYHPHLTLGRVREGARVRNLGESLSANAVVRFGDWTAESCSLMQSQLSPHGSIYREVRTCPLAAGS